jgi:predicted HAD superfamily hydrolase
MLVANEVYKIANNLLENKHSKSDYFCFLVSKRKHGLESNALIVIWHYILEFHSKKKILRTKELATTDERPHATELSFV